jgi:hypothetical protein
MQTGSVKLSKTSEFDRQKDNAPSVVASPEPSALGVAAPLATVFLSLPLTRGDNVRYTFQFVLTIPAGAAALPS